MYHLPVNTQHFPSDVNNSDAPLMNINSNSRRFVAMFIIMSVLLCHKLALVKVTDDDDDQIMSAAKSSLKMATCLMFSKRFNENDSLYTADIDLHLLSMVIVLTSCEVMNNEAAEIELVSLVVLW